MFTGIVEALGEVIERTTQGNNVHFKIKSPISAQLGVDDSVSHQGVCLTVTKVDNDIHTVTAVDETLQRTNLGEWKVGSILNLERSLLFNGRIDGHIVQGHVDTTAKCVSIEERGGSHFITFQLSTPTRLTVDKGSVCVDGVSLTVVQPTDTRFSVAIIPFTFEHTAFKQLAFGTTVNIEFDIVGKYIERMAMPHLNLAVSIKS